MLLSLHCATPWATTMLARPLTSLLKPYKPEKNISYKPQTIKHRQWEMIDGFEPLETKLYKQAVVKQPVANQEL